MSYAWDITIPANKPEAAPLERTLHFHPGVIVKIDFEGAPGQHRMVKCRLLFGRFQLVPLSRGEWISLDRFPISYPTYFEIIKEPAELIFQGCSPGTTYEHKVTVRIAVLPKSVASMIPVIELLTRLLQRIGVLR